MSDIDVTSAIADRGRDLRIQGQIIPPAGTTAGQVLTATLAASVLGSNWQTPAGGGGIPTLFDSTLAVDGTFDFAGIAQTSAHMLIYGSLRTDRAATTDIAGLRFNNDAAADYDAQIVFGSGAAAGAVQKLAQTSIHDIDVEGNTATAGLFAPLVLFVPDYANTSRQKAVVWLVFRFASTVVEAGGGNWNQTSAITRVQMLPIGGGVNFKAGSRLSGYGIG